MYKCLWPDTILKKNANKNLLWATLPTHHVEKGSGNYWQSFLVLDLEIVISNQIAEQLMNVTCIRSARTWVGRASYASRTRRAVRIYRYDVLRTRFCILENLQHHLLLYTVKGTKHVHHHIHSRCRWQVIGVCNCQSPHEAGRLWFKECQIIFNTFVTKDGELLVKVLMHDVGSLKNVKI